MIVPIDFPKQCKIKNTVKNSGLLFYVSSIFLINICARHGILHIFPQAKADLLLVPPERHALCTYRCGWISLSRPQTWFFINFCLLSWFLVSDLCEKKQTFCQSQLFQEIDTSGDGILQLDEFVTGIEQVPALFCWSRHFSPFFRCCC